MTATPALDCLPDERSLSLFYATLATTVHQTAVFGARTFLVSGACGFKRALTLVKALNHVELVHAEHALDWLIRHGLPEQAAAHLLRNSAKPN